VIFSRTLYSDRSAGDPTVNHRGDDIKTGSSMNFIRTYTPLRHLGTFYREWNSY